MSEQDEEYTPKLCAVCHQTEAINGLEVCLDCEMDLIEEMKVYPDEYDTAFPEGQGY